MKNDNEIEEDLEVKLKKYEKLRVEAIRKGRKFYYILIPLAIITLGLSYYSPVLVIVAFCIWFISVGLSQKDTNKLMDVVKTDIFTKVVADTFPGSTYSIEEGIDLHSVMEVGLLHGPDRYFSEDMITATYKNIPFITSDIKLQDKHQTTDSKGHTKTSYTTYFRGKFIKIDLLRDLDLTLKIIEKNKISLFKSSMKGLETIETESIAFNDKFKTFSTSQQDAFYVLTPQMQEKLLKMEEEYDGKMYYCFKQGFFYCLIDNRLNGLEINRKKPLDMVAYNKILEEINITPRIIDEFNFNSDKWINTNR